MRTHKCVCVIQEGYIVPTNTNVEPTTRGNLPKRPSVLRRASCATSHSIPRTRYAPLDAHGFRACCHKHSCRRVPDGLELFSRPSGDQGKTANSRAKQERETRSVVRLFSQDNVGSHFSLSRTGTSRHCSYTLQFPSLSHDSTH
jgi:hypothetical protein